MNIFTRYFCVPAVAALLGACGGGQEQAGQPASNQTENPFRQEFIVSFTRSCLKNIPAEAAVPADLAQKVCACSAEKAADTVGPADIAKWMAGDKEVEKRVIAAAADCKEELHRALDAAPASQASQTASE